MFAVEDSCVRVLFRSGLSAFLLNSGEISKMFGVEDLHVRVFFRSGLSAFSLNSEEISKIFGVEDLYVRVLFRSGRCVVEVSLSAFSLNNISPNEFEHCGQHVCLTFVKAILRSYILSQVLYQPGKCFGEQRQKVSFRRARVVQGRRGFHSYLKSTTSGYCGAARCLGLSSSRRCCYEALGSMGKIGSRPTPRLLMTLAFL
jgi:hypothetical protein